METIIMGNIYVYMYILASRSMGKEHGNYKG